jgi:hypothetical protein
MEDLIHATITTRNGITHVFNIANEPRALVSDVVEYDGITPTRDIKTMAEVGAVRAMPPWYGAARFKCLGVFDTTINDGLITHHVILTPTNASITNA